MEEQERLVQICDQCGCASCWHGEFMCSGSANAGTEFKTVAELDKLNIEHSDHYSKDKMVEIYGYTAPQGYFKGVK